jgi:type IV pilus assembly protein PilW
MNKPTAPTRLRHDQGLTLIELMVSLVIGLILMIAVVSTYLGASGAGRASEAQGRMNEDAQAALTILAQQLRMAGNNPKRANYTTAAPRNPVYGAGTYIVRGCDGKFSDITTAATIPALTCAAGGGTSADSIAVSYEADSFNTIATSGGAATDCLGNSLPVVTPAPQPQVWDGAVVGPPATVITYTVADNRFYIATSAAITSPSLYCKGSGNATPQPLVENVEDLQLTYGVANSTAATLEVAGYLSAAGIVADPDLSLLADDVRWSKVVTVRICVVMRSAVPVVTDSVSARYTKCDGTVNTSPPDLRLRRAYSTTVVLRNRVAL